MQKRNVRRIPLVEGERLVGMVTLDDGTTVPFIIGADGDSPLEGSLPSSPSTGTQPKSLTYWYIDQ